MWNDFTTRIGKRHPHTRIAKRRAKRAGTVFGGLVGASYLAGRRAKSLYRQVRKLGRWGGAPVKDQVLRLAYRARRAKVLGRRFGVAGAIAGGLGAAYVLQPLLEAHGEVLERKRWERKIRRGQIRSIGVYQRHRRPGSKYGPLVRREQQGRRFA